MPALASPRGSVEGLRAGLWRAVPALLPLCCVTLMCPQPVGALASTLRTPLVVLGDFDDVMW